MINQPQMINLAMIQAINSQPMKISNQNEGIAQMDNLMINRQLIRPRNLLGHFDNNP